MEVVWTKTTYFLVPEEKKVYLLASEKKWWSRFVLNQNTSTLIKFVRDDRIADGLERTAQRGRGVRDDPNPAQIWARFVGPRMARGVLARPLVRLPELSCIKYVLGLIVFFCFFFWLLWCLRALDAVRDPNRPTARSVCPRGHANDHIRTGQRIRFGSPR
jgi:hypothetical protein